MKMKNGRTTAERPPQKITAETPLTVLEQRFLQEYIRTGSQAQAIRATGIELPSDASYNTMAHSLFNQPNIQAELAKMKEEIRNQTLADATEVMRYFTSVMRGEVKDQFGLDAPLAERTKAAMELAKRTIDIENRKAGEPDQTIEIKLDWNR